MKMKESGKLVRNLLCLDKQIGIYERGQFHKILNPIKCNRSSMKKVKLISTLFDKLAGFFIKFKMTEKNGHRLIGVNCA